jgi:hypothetical protein
VTRRLFAPLFIVGFLGIAGCSSNSRQSIKTDVQSAISTVGNAAGNAADNAAEVAVRNIATQQGEEQFKNAKQTLSGPLTCTAKVASGVSKIDVSCTGQTQTGGAATLKGTTDEIPGASIVSLKGQFVGAVNGNQVFSVDHLGG